MATVQRPHHDAERAPADPATPGPPRGSLPWVLAGAATVLLGIGAFVISTGFDSPREIRVLGPSLPVNEGARNALDLSANNSPSLVANPADHNNLAVANRIDSPRFGCALHVSFDAGGHWEQAAIPAPRGQTTCYAPDVAFGADGTLYLAYVTLRGRANAPNAVWLSTSSDGGRTLTEPERVPVSRRPFQMRLVADPDEPRRLYLTWLQGGELGLYKFTEPGNPIRAMRSDDGGRNWSRPATVSSPARGRVVAPVPALGPKGEVYVLYLDLRDDVLDYHGGHEGRGGPPYPGAWQLVLARSTDGGRRFEESLVEAELTPTERFIVFTPPSPSLAVDRDDGRVFAAFHDGRLGDADVWLWRLDPGASEWSRPVRVNDTPARDGAAQYLPRLSVAPDGRLDVVYYDRRGDERDVLNDVSYQASFDEGESFSERVRLSDRPFSSRIGYGSERRLPDLGSRLGLVSADRRALAAWTDTRAGTRATSKQDIGQGIVGMNDPPRLSGGVESLLRYGGLLLVLLGVFIVSWRLAARSATNSP